MRGQRARLLPVLLATAAGGCGARPDAVPGPAAARWTPPWWPSARKAAPSPLLDAAGIAPPALTGPECYADGGPPRRAGDWQRSWAWLAAARYLARGPGVTCALTGAPPRGAPGLSVEDRGPPATALVRAAPGGRVEYAGANSAGLSAAEAQAAADSVLRRGLALPSARPLACGTLDAAHGGTPVRGWATPDYQAIVIQQPGWLRSARGHVVSVQVTSTRFPACDPARRGSRVAGAGGGAPAT